MMDFEFCDMQLATANKIIIPAVAAVKFPTLEVNYPDGSSCKLPITSQGNDANASTENIPKVSLLCLSFRASSQVRLMNICFSTISPCWCVPVTYISDIALYCYIILNSLVNTRIVSKKVVFFGSHMMGQTPLKFLS